MMSIESGAAAYSVRFRTPAGATNLLSLGSRRRGSRPFRYGQRFELPSGTLTEQRMGGINEVPRVLSLAKWPVTARAEAEDRATRQVHCKGPAVRFDPSPVARQVAIP
jgi:hypothetical protein